MAAPPPDFVDLSTGYQQFGKSVNLIGICVDHLPARQTGGPDFTIKFTLHDSSWHNGKGMIFRFFHKDQQKLPAIQRNGDILIIRNIKTKDYRGDRIGLSNAVTSWVVLDGTAVHESKCPNGTDITKFAKSSIAGSPSTTELVYAKALSATSAILDPSLFSAQSPTASLQTPSITAASGTIIPAQTKFSLIQDLVDWKFVDLVGEARRVYSNDYRVEVYITDYTDHPKLFNYVDDDTNGLDGDTYCYQTSTQRQWKGPWGKRTLCVCLWEPHAQYARRNILEGQYVSLRNVQIKMDKSDRRLEGHCRGDRDFPDRVSVSLLKPKDAEKNARLKELLARKREYESKAKAQYRRVERAAAVSETGKTTTLDENAQRTTSTKITAKNRKKKEKKKGSGQALDENRNAKTNDNQIQTSKVTPRTSCNPQIRIYSIEVPFKAIDQILDPESLKRTTPKGIEFNQPFQNCRYKSKVRVLDFFPDNIADFAAPHCPSEYEILSDYESDSDADIQSHCSGGEITWEWRFLLLVEDATGPQKRRMEILVADTDGDHLLNQTACDLRRNPEQLAILIERLFIMWGNLLEVKTSASEKGAELDVKQLSAVPFECLIQEYGISTKIVDRDTVETERMFRMFGTTIK